MCIILFEKDSDDREDTAEDPNNTKSEGRLESGDMVMIAQSMYDSKVLVHGYYEGR